MLGSSSASGSGSGSGRGSGCGSGSGSGSRTIGMNAEVLAAAMKEGSGTDRPTD